MTGFTKCLGYKYENEVQCCFHRINSIKAHIYFVTITAGSKDYHFNMKFSGDRWRIINAPALPHWVMGLEEELEKFIKEWE